ncbi:MAG: hypothetical protein KGL18_02465 [Burkholderiales bacterium]|nr:hypothetical protein [Burkholderiales bacterium]MDE1926155.1 hypothetical protein [Burkholderiales bacterium]MDE2158042.1 hypothetical protein [Burkholderiales bacterium]MDE2501831.1 hypothetical protein [Burkholderiales bacterium]
MHAHTTPLAAVALAPGAALAALPDTFRATDEAQCLGVALEDRQGR